jgi:hypothetical protein
MSPSVLYDLPYRSPNYHSCSGPVTPSREIIRRHKINVYRPWKGARSTNKEKERGGKEWSYV